MNYYQKRSNFYNKVARLIKIYHDGENQQTNHDEENQQTNFMTFTIQLQKSLNKIDSNQEFSQAELMTDQL